MSVDAEAVKAEARNDGKYVLQSNSSLPSEEVAQAYKSLWQVERAFCELKSGLDLRPVYHWTEKRIRGHVMVLLPCPRPGDGAPPEAGRHGGEGPLR